MHPWKRSAWDSKAWRPDARASLAMAAAAALLVMAGFAALFSAVPGLRLSQDADRVREQLLLAEPAPSVPTRHRRAPERATPARVPLLRSAWPPLPAPITAPDSFTSRDYLDERAREGAAALQQEVMGSDLRRNLGKPAERQALPDDQGYRSIDGQKIVRSGGKCSQIQTVQGSSSPTNHIDIAEPMGGCAGAPSEQEQMSKALDDWAKEQHASNLPPP
ncbi:MAG TPA: hypothetical protein VLV87_08400 [Gammaproteobacteria bacterium]|nr:hypothetical protein [Gammaproteobacteria bacterium]